MTTDTERANGVDMEALHQLMPSGHASDSITDAFVQLEDDILYRDEHPASAAEGVEVRRNQGVPHSPGRGHTGAPSSHRRGDGPQRRTARFVRVPGERHTRSLPGARLPRRLRPGRPGMSVEDRIPQHLLDEHDELVSMGYALDAALREFLGRCEALDAELNTRLHPSLGDDQGDLAHDVMDRANGERLALASAMLLRLQHAAIATDRISRWLVDLYGLSGPGIDEHDPQADDRRLMDYVEALVGDDPDQWKQELYRICRNERESRLALRYGADALRYLNRE